MNSVASNAALLNYNLDITPSACNLAEAQIDTPYAIRSIETDDDEIKDFLFTLGCYAGEQVTVISRLADNFVITVKDARYSIDLELAAAIMV